MTRWKEKIRELCGIDIRSLALFRICLAFILLIDLSIRVQDLRAHYSDDGILPRDALIYQIIDTWNISVHLVNGTWQVQLILFVLAGLFAMALLVGYRTRLATILSWIFLISLQTRNPMILQGGDIVLRMLLFWGMFLPLGSLWSIDAQKDKERTYPTQIVSAATLSLLLQVCFIYWFSALLKSDTSWRHEGTAIWYALSNEFFITPFGLFMLQFPKLLKFLTFSTFYFEAFGPFFAFSPVWTGPLRFATVIAFMLFHLVGLNFTMELAHFPYVCAVAWIVFIPAWFWNRLFIVMRVVSHINSEIPWKASWYSNGIAVLCCSYVFLWNVNMLGMKVLPPGLSSVGELLRIDQYWNMFAPYPIKEDGWFVIPGKLRDGTEIDLYTQGEPVSWEKPKDHSALFKNDRWKSYMMSLFFSEDSTFNLSLYARYLCIHWNENHSDAQQLATFEIVFMMKVNSIEDPQPKSPEKIVLWNHQCY